MRFMKFRADSLPKETIVKNRWLIAAVTYLGLVMVVMAVSSVNVTIPTLSVELGASARELQWIVDNYALVFAGLLLPMGALGDRFGRRRAFLSGLVIFGVASFFAAYSGSPTELIAWRGLMGVGAALIMPATLSIITNVFPAKDRPRAVALWAGFAGAGASIGPILAGYLLESYWWGSVFLALIPIIAITILLTVLYVPTSKDPEEPALDFVGAGLSIVGLGALLFGIIEAPENGWLSAETIAAILISIVAFYAFVRWENRAKEPMLPMKYFKIPNFSVGSLMITFMFFSMFGLFFVLLQYLQFVLGLSALDAALWTLPLAGTFVFVSPFGPILAKKFDQRRVSTFGVLIAGLGLLSFSQLSVDSQFFPDILVGLLVMGSGMALAMPLATDAIISSIPRRKAGVGSAVNDTTRELGGALGIAVIGSLLADGYRSSIDGKVDFLPTEFVEGAEESIGAAINVTREYTTDGAELIATANSAFIDGMSLAFIVAGAVMIATSLVVYKYLPTKLTVAKDD